VGAQVTALDTGIFDIAGLGTPVGVIFKLDEADPANVAWVYIAGEILPPA